MYTLYIYCTSVEVVGMATAPQSTHGVVTDCMTLTRYLLEEQRKYPEATGDLTQLMSHVLTAVKAVGSAVRRAGLVSLYVHSTTVLHTLNSAFQIRIT